MLFVSQLISLQGPCPAFDMCVLLPPLSIGLEPEGRGQSWAFLQQTTITTFREFVKPELRRKEPNLFNIAWGAAFFIVNHAQKDIQSVVFTTLTLFFFFPFLCVTIQKTAKHYRVTLSVTRAGTKSQAHFVN